MTTAPIASEAHALALDAQDQLAPLRAGFRIPKKAAVVPPEFSGLSPAALDEDCVYLAGNSLGLMPTTTIGYVQQELEVWGDRCGRPSLCDADGAVE